MYTIAVIFHSQKNIKHWVGFFVQWDLDFCSNLFLFNWIKKTWEPLCEFAWQILEGFYQVIALQKAEEK